MHTELKVIEPIITARLNGCTLIEFKLLKQLLFAYPITYSFCNKVLLFNIHSNSLVTKTVLVKFKFMFRFA